MEGTDLFFYLFSALVILSGLMVVSARNPVHAVMFLIFAFINAAGIFLLLGAEFLAMTLVIVYVGAVAVLFLFVVMMLDIDFAELRALYEIFPDWSSNRLGRIGRTDCPVRGLENKKWAQCRKSADGPRIGSAYQYGGFGARTVYRICFLFRGCRHNSANRHDWSNHFDPPQ